MEAFEYLKEEEKLVLCSLNELVGRFSEKTREQVFDEVKAVCDQLRGYLKKQSVLLLDKIEGQECATGVKTAVKARDELQEDIDNLVMVHVDEPGYRDYLGNLLEKSKVFFDCSDELYADLKKSLSTQIVREINEAFSAVIHSDVGFNSLAGSGAQVAKAPKNS